MDQDKFNRINTGTIPAIAALEAIERKLNSGTHAATMAAVRKATLFGNIPGSITAMSDFKERSAALEALLSPAAKLSKVFGSAAEFEKASFNGINASILASMSLPSSIWNAEKRGTILDQVLKTPLETITANQSLFEKQDAITRFLTKNYFEANELIVPEWIETQEENKEFNAATVSVLEVMNVDAMETHAKASNENTSTIEASLDQLVSMLKEDNSSLITEISKIQVLQKETIEELNKVSQTVKEQSEMIEKQQETIDELKHGVEQDREKQVDDPLVHLNKRLAEQLIGPLSERLGLTMQQAYTLFYLLNGTLYLILRQAVEDYMN